MYVTVNLPDIIPDSLEYALESTKITFKARAGEYVTPVLCYRIRTVLIPIFSRVSAKKDYAFTLDLFKDVVPDVRAISAS